LGDQALVDFCNVLRFQLIAIEVEIVKEDGFDRPRIKRIPSSVVDRYKTLAGIFADSQNAPSLGGEG
jgi:hypothetical protein